MNQGWSESKMPEFKMSAIIKLNEHEWFWIQIELAWVSIRVEWECFWVIQRLKITRCLNPTLQWMWFHHGWMQDGQILDGRIQNACQYQFRWEWMSLSQIELVWISIRVEWECLWVILREDNKVSESNMAVCDSNMAEFKMAAIIKLSQNEWVKFFCANGGNQSWQVWVSLRGKSKIAESRMD